MTKKILIVNGPNLLQLGTREPDIYGHQTYKDLSMAVKQKAKSLHVGVKMRQSNHEGVLLDWILSASRHYDGIIINPGAYTHTSIALADAVRCITIPVVEVHLTDITKRENYRKVSFIAEAVTKTIMGCGMEGYTNAMQFLFDFWQKST